MVALPVRPLTMPGVALAAVGALTLAPALVAPVAVAPPTVTAHVEDLRLAGIGLDIYYAITPVVQYAVGGVSYLINFIPLVGGLTAAQININYFQGVQPVVEATVNYLAAVVQDPLSFFPTTADYGNTLFGIGYNWVSAQLMFIGLDPLAPLPQGSAAMHPGAVTRTPAPAAVEVAGQPDAAEATEVAAPAPVAGRPSARPPLSDSAVRPARESLRGGHTAKQSRVARPAAVASAQDTDTAATGAPRSGKATADRD